MLAAVTPNTSNLKQKHNNKMYNNKEATINERIERGKEELAEDTDGGVCRAIGGRHKDWLKPGRRGS